MLVLVVSVDVVVVVRGQRGLGRGGCLEDGGGVEGTGRVAVEDGLVDGGLEAGLDDDEVGAAHVADGGGGELEVVRFAAEGGEVRDDDAVSADLLGDELERVERGEDLEPAVVPCRRPARGEREERREGAGRACGAVGAPGRRCAIHDLHSQ